MPDQDAEHCQEPDAKIILVGDMNCTHNSTDSRKGIFGWFIFLDEGRQGFGSDHRCSQAVSTTITALMKIAF
jgi:exonuclease III